MPSKKKRLQKKHNKPQSLSLQDHLPSIQSLFLVICSIIISFLLWQSGWLYGAIHRLGSLEYLGVFLAGIGFVSIFTAAPSAVVLLVLSQDIAPPIVAIIAGFGSMIGDLVLFSIISKFFPHHKKISPDVTGILRIISHLRHTKYRMILTMIGAFVIVSPLPDELGLALMGLGRVPWWMIACITFVLNSIGIYLLIYIL